MSRETFLRGHLDAVTPSTYVNLKGWKERGGCGHQLLWAGDSPLSPFPAAKIGDVVHNVMEKVGANLDREGAARLWDVECQKIDEDLRKSPVTRGLAPLSQTVKGFELRRLMTIRMASKRAAALNVGIGIQGNGEHEHPLIEASLRSHDGLLRGRIDLLERREEPEGFVLIDYKSGGVLDVEDDGVEQIQERYQLQLLLYAALLLEAKGIRIKKAVLKTLDGREHEVPIDIVEAEKAALQARELLREFNEIAQEGLNDLARPLPKDNLNHTFGCAGCLYRPVCKPYLNANRFPEENKKWPNDVIGRVTSVNRVYESICIKIQPFEGAEAITINFRDSAARHQELEKITANDTVCIFDYIRGRTANYDGPRTSIVKMNTLA